MGGSAQFRKKLQEKSKPQTAFEQVRARFGEDVIRGIEGKNQEGIAKGLIAMADKYGDDVIRMMTIVNASLPDGVGGSTNVISGRIIVDGERSDAYSNSTYSMSGANGEETAALTTAHELTHRITGFTATDEIRKSAEIEDTMLNKYGLSRTQYMEGIQTAYPDGFGVSDLERWLYFEKRFRFTDANTLAWATVGRIDSRNKLCSRAIKIASESAGVSQDFLKSVISEYASKGGDKEAVPEAVADVTINGDKASWASKAVYNAFNELLN